MKLLFNSQAKYTFPNIKDVYDQIVGKDFQIEDFEQLQVSEELKKLIVKLLCRDPERRIPMSCILQQKWFKLYRKDCNWLKGNKRIHCPKYELWKLKTRQADTSQ